MLQTFQEQCEEAVGQFGGTVVQCDDKGLLACFGFPVAFEDAASRAARSGRSNPGRHEGLSDGFRRQHAEAESVGRSFTQGQRSSSPGRGVVSLVGEARNVAVRLEEVAVAGSDRSAPRPLTACSKDGFTASPRAAEGSRALLTRSNCSAWRTTRWPGVRFDAAPRPSSHL